MGKTAIERLKESNVWDDKYGIPNAPAFNNPHIYVAYCYMIAKKADEAQLAFPLDNKDTVEKYLIMGQMYRRFFNLCKINEDTVFEGKKLKNGAFSRFPGGRGGDTSHDEIMGAAYMDNGISAYLIDYLTKLDGQFTANEVALYDESRNQFRFWWLMPFLKACAGYRVSLLSQFAWGLYAVIDAVGWKGDCSGPLKTWLMYDKMKKYPVSAIFCFFGRLGWRRSTS